MAALLGALVMAALLGVFGLAAEAHYRVTCCRARTTADRAAAMVRHPAGSRR